MNTPKADAVVSFIACYPNSGEGMEVVDADFARQLETQVQELREALEKISAIDLDARGAKTAVKHIARAILEKTK